MRHRILSLVLAGLAILALASSAFAQVGRMDQIIGFAQTPGIPSVASGTFVPQVQATDDVSATAGTLLVPYVDDLQAWVASNLGWRSSRPVTFLLFSNTDSLINTVQALRGSPLSPDERNLVLSQPSFLVEATNSADGVQAGNPAILVNTDLNAATQTAMDLAGAFNLQVGLVPPPPATQDDGMRLIQQSMARNYATLMELDTSGTAGPSFYREGLADAVAFRVVPGTPQESGQPETVSSVLATTGTLPTLANLEQNWNSFVIPGGTSFDTAHGIAFLSTNTVFDKVGGAGALSILRDTAAGQNFDTALQLVSGFSLDQLNTAYQPLIPAP